MKSEHPFDILIPAPVSVVKQEGAVTLANLKTLHADPEFTGIAEEFVRLAAVFGIRLAVSPDPDADLVLRRNDTLETDEWSIRVDPSAVLAESAGRTGMSYAFSAFAQMLFAAEIRGPASAVLPCGTVTDKPRFAWRGFMLDSARHFQTPATVKAVIRLMAHFRLNTFHWHLTDNQGWRIASDAVPPEANAATLTAGQYTKDELRGVAEFAARHGVRIVPEIDIPGHSRGLLKACPQYACDDAAPGGEFCLGNPETIPFLKKVFAELLDIFPDSPVIHMGGDEADTAHWEKCPRCLAAMKAAGCGTMRGLENRFMTEMTRFLIERGRTPMLWGTCSGQTYPPDTIIQSWLDIREPLRVAPNGNKVVYSVHNSLYFDYPENLSEPFETWMFELSEKGVYMTDPHIIWEEKVKDAIIGTEACLWTERVPEWRVMRKILPRLGAYAECAWSLPGKKLWHDFLRRKELLEAAGYYDFLLGNCRERGEE